MHVENYRPVSTLCAIPKIMDEILAKMLYDKFKNQIYKSQHGFAEGRSVVTNLFRFSEGVVNSLIRGIQVDTIYLDLPTAFDTLDIELLPTKLHGWDQGGA